MNYPIPISSGTAGLSGLPMNNIHGNLTVDPKPSIERTIIILGKRIQVQHLILAGTTVALGIGSLLLEGNTNESDAPRSH